jgi:ATP-dependent DNA helicase RecQ
MGPDETPRICLTFENGYIEEIAHRLGCSQTDVRGAYRFTSGVDDFLAELTGRRAPDDEAWVRSVFPQLRLREDTFRALYRLSVLGVVTDFEADYATKTVTADLAHLRPGECRENLRRYLLNHAPMEADDYLRLADGSPQATELRRCLHALVAFVYERIARQRLEALTIMEQTCVRGVEDSEAFREAVTYFFDSMYLPRLRPHLQEYNAELVITTIKDTAGSAAKLSHLLGACNRLLPENPENAAFRALRGYAMALLGYAKHDAVSELESAADRLSSVLAWTRAERLVFLDRLRLCFVAVPDASTVVIDTVILNEHSRWLEKFNGGNQSPGAGQSNAAGLDFREAIAGGEMP